MAKVRQQRQQRWQQLGVKQNAICFSCVCRAIMVVQPSFVTSLRLDSTSTHTLKTSTAQSLAERLDALAVPALPHDLVLLVPHRSTSLHRSKNCWDDGVADHNVRRVQ